jgi:hypothetical protein
LSWPGFVFASAMNSLRLLTETFGGTTSTSSEFISGATGTKSRSNLYGLFELSVSTVVCVA